MSTLSRVIKYLSIVLGLYLVYMMISGITSLVYDIKVYKDSNNDVSKNIELKEDYIKWYDSIDIDLGYSDLEIYDSNNDFKIEVSNDNIKYYEKDNKFIVRDMSGINIKIKNRNVVKLYIPTTRNINLLDIDMGSGKLYIDRINANYIDLELGAGSTIINDINVLKFDIETGAGVLDINNGIIKNMDLELGVGKSNINAILRGNNKIELGVGSSNINLNDIIDNYTLKIEKGIGSIYVDDKEIKNNTTYGNGDNLIEISGGIGSINVRFGSD